VVGRKWPLRQTERLFRQERHQDERLRQPTVLGYSEWPKHSPNYWALRRWVMRGLDLSQGLVRQARAAQGSEQVRSRARATEELGTSSCRLRSFSRTESSMARRSTAPTSSRSADPRYHHGCDQRHVRLRLRLRQPEEAV